MSDMTLADLKKALLIRVNEEVGVPFVGEETERRILELVLTPILDRVPVQLLPLMLSAADGLTSDELAEHIDSLSDFVNTLVDIPYVAEALEGRLIELVLRSALSPLLSGSSV